MPRRPKSKNRSGARICFWDIESSSLNAPFGIMLSFGWKFQGEKKAKVISIADFPNFKKDPTCDKALVKATAEILNEADIWVTHYGQRFDVPMVQTKLLEHKLPPLPPIPHVDTWRVARYKKKMHSNRLDALARYLEVADEKTVIDFKYWKRAVTGDRRAIKYIVDHNRADVYVLEQVYDRIRGLITNHPNVNIVDPVDEACPVCGSQKLQRRGFNLASVSRTQRFHCQDCGAWSRGRPQRVSGMEVR